MEGWGRNIMVTCQTRWPLKFILEQLIWRVIPMFSQLDDALETFDKIVLLVLGLQEGEFLPRSLMIRGRSKACSEWGLRRLSCCCCCELKVKGLVIYKSSLTHDWKIKSLALNDLLCLYLTDRDAIFGNAIDYLCSGPEISFRKKIQETRRSVSYAHLFTFYFP